jgi:DNA topoisomerase-3
LAGGNIVGPLTFTSKAGKKFKARLLIDTSTGYKLKMDLPDEKLSEIACPGCGAMLLKSEDRLRCTACGFSIWTTISERKLSDDEILLLFRTGRIGPLTGFMSKTGRAFGAYLVMDGDGKITFEFPRPEVIDLKCPSCGGDLMATEDLFFCSKKECGFRIFREICGIGLTEGDMKDLTECGRTGVIPGFVSKKSGRVFAAALALVKREDGKWRTDFVFERGALRR